ncbi:MAG: hypothetical protein FWG24_01040 [Eggerthellaceae bacterium]|nr:hypothetical protein [Eggerthellaceae bacterium]
MSKPTNEHQNETKLKAAFEQMGPSTEARERMLAHILTAHEEGAQKATEQVSVATSTETPTKGEETAEAKATQETAPSETSTEEYTDIDPPENIWEVPNLPRYQKPNPILHFAKRYVVPLAACLLLAAIVPIVYLQFNAASMDFNAAAPMSAPNEKDLSAASPADQDSAEGIVGREPQDAQPQDGQPNEYLPAPPAQSENEPQAEEGRGATQADEGSAAPKADEGQAESSASPLNPLEVASATVAAGAALGVVLGTITLG